MMKTGIELIAEERKRQIEKERWTPEHDAQHKDGSLARAAACYALAAVVNVRGRYFGDKVSWPWDEKWWKPSKNPIRNLEKAGALIAAEIDRLQRKDQRRK